MKLNADFENIANWPAGKDFSVAEAVDKPVDQIHGGRTITGSADAAAPLP